MIGLIGGLAVVLAAFVAFAFPEVAFLPFIIAIGTVTLASALAVLAPREVGHVLAIIIGVAAMVGGFAAFVRGMPPVLPLTLCFSGVLMEVLVLYSWQQKSRAAWSFLTAICAVLFICMFFGAPKVKGLLGVGIWTALIVPGLLAAATIALSVIYRDYDGGARPSAPATAAQR